MFWAYGAQDGMRCKKNLLDQSFKVCICFIEKCWFHFSFNVLHCNVTALVSNNRTSTQNVIGLLWGTGLPFWFEAWFEYFLNSNFLKEKHLVVLGPGIFQLAWRNGNDRKGNKRALMEMKGKERENGPLWLITLRGQPPLCATPLLMTVFNSTSCIVSYFCRGTVCKCQRATTE